MNQKGFLQVILLGVIAVLILAGAGGFLIFQEKKIHSFIALGNLCYGEDGCYEYCKNKVGRCKEYCLNNPQNELCKNHFSLEAENQRGKSWEPYTELQKPKPQVISPLPSLPLLPPPPPSLPKTVEQFMIAKPQPWVPDVMTQPVPPGASKTRLTSLPAPLAKLSLKDIGAFGSHQGGHIEGLDDEAGERFSGTWEADYINKRMIMHNPRGVIYQGKIYGIFDLDETGPRAILKIEFKADSYPESFSDKAIMYTERDALSIRQDASDLGVRENPY